jgi:hypothetical protein
MTINELNERRNALGMTYDVLAKRAGMPASTVKRILTKCDDRASLANVTAIAEALGLRVELAADTNPAQFRKQQAQKKARWLTSLVQGSSALEAQAVDSETYGEIENTILHKLLSGSRRRLWN